MHKKTRASLSPKVTRQRVYRLAFIMMLVFVSTCAPARATTPVQVTDAAWNTDWNAGTDDCHAAAPPPLQVHPYDAHTYILRENLCTDSEANFMYLLIGSDRAMLIDTGAIAEESTVPLAKKVLELLPSKDGSQLPLVVVHTHGHTDHRTGDAQFNNLPSVQVVSSEMTASQQFFGITSWPTATGKIDLGNRLIDVVPTPGHHEAHVVFYDHQTTLLFSGDFLMPGRLLVEDEKAYHQSATRLADFVTSLPVAAVLGGHIELNAKGEAYGTGATHHPDEHDLALSKNDILALPDTLAHFNGFYATHPHFHISNPVHNLLALVTGVLVGATLLIWGIRRFIKKRRQKKGASAPKNTKQTPPPKKETK